MRSPSNTEHFDDLRVDLCGANYRVIDDRMGGRYLSRMITRGDGDALVVRRLKFAGLPRLVSLGDYLLKAGPRCRLFDAVEHLAHRHALRLDFDPPDIFS
jgi:hypothetical protein